VSRLDKLEAAKTQSGQGSLQSQAESKPAQPVAADSAMTLPFLNTPLRGFADIGGVAGNERGQRKGFTVGSLDLFLTPELGGNFKGLIETVFEVDSEGKLAVDLERLQVGYAFGDYLTTWLGRFHTPYGYWNTAFHHGTQIQTAVRRPSFIDFEDKGGILPAHTVGLWGTGGMSFESGRVGYDLFVGNAPTIEDGVLNMNMAGLSNFRPSVGVNLSYGFRNYLEGLKLGLHWLRADVQNTTLSNKTNLTTTGGYLTYLNDPWEFIAELYRFDNKDISGKTGTHGSWATFAQLGREFGRWTPYGRFEWSSLNRSDPYFRDMESGQSYTRQAFGVRYNVTPKVALKLEYRHTVNKDSLGGHRANNGAESQIAIRF
jgi:opacity protein-like surface antigen